MRGLAQGSPLAPQCIPWRVARIAAAKVNHVYGEHDAEGGSVNSLILERQRSDEETQTKRELAEKNPSGPWEIQGNDRVVFYKGRSSSRTIEPSKRLYCTDSTTPRSQGTLAQKGLWS